MAPADRELTKDGFELQFGTNHLGHFELTHCLHRALVEAGTARIVVVSSVAHRRADVDLEDPNFERRPYDPWVAHGQSKTANVLFAVEAARRWHADEISANALHPGGINTTLDRFQGAGYHQRLEAQFGGPDKIPWKTPKQGAATSALLAASPLVEGITGAYFEGLNEALPTEQALAASGANAGSATPYALDPERARALWELSERLVKETALPLPLERRDHRGAGATFVGVSDPLLPASHAFLVEEPHFAHLATVRPDGSPRSSLMWFAWDGSRFRFTHTTTRQKVRNVEHEPRVAFSIADPSNPYRSLEVRGEVESIEPDGDGAPFYASLQERYGVSYPITDASVRVIITVRPTGFNAVEGGQTATERAREPVAPSGRPGSTPTGG